MECAGCGENKDKGYNRSPFSGQLSPMFWCDSCYERLFHKTAQSAAHNLSKEMRVVKTARR